MARLPDGAAHATVERVDRAAVELGERGGDGVTERAVQLWVVEALELGELGLRICPVLRHGPGILAGQLGERPDEQLEVPG